MWVLWLCHLSTKHACAGAQNLHTWCDHLRVKRLYICVKGKYFTLSYDRNTLYLVSEEHCSSNAAIFIFIKWLKMLAFYRNVIKVYTFGAAFSDAFAALWIHVLQKRLCAPSSAMGQCSRNVVSTRENQDNIKSFTNNRFALWNSCKVEGMCFPI